MSLTTTARNQALNSIAIDSMSLHSGFPGATGANELTGGSYARVACAFNSASGGVRTVAAATNFSMSAGHNVAWVNLWAAGVSVGYAPNGGTPKEFMADAASDVITVPGHGFSNGDTVVFYGGTVPSPLAEGTIYFVVLATTDTFKVAATSGGAAIDLVGTGAGDCVVSIIVVNNYGGAGTHTISSFSLGAVF